MATATPDSYTVPSGQDIDAGRWPAADYAVVLSLASDAGADANPGDRVTMTLTITNAGAQSPTNAVIESEVADGNFTMVNGSVTTDIAGAVITQQDTRVQVDVPSLTSGEVTWQADVAAGIPTPHYVSNVAQLEADQMGPQPSNLLIIAVEAASGDELFVFTNPGFEFDVLSPGGQIAANDWSNVTAYYPNDAGPAAFEGNNVGEMPSSGTPLTLSDATDLAAEQTVKLEYWLRGATPWAETQRTIGVTQSLGGEGFEQMRGIQTDTPGDVYGYNVHFATWEKAKTSQQLSVSYASNAGNAGAGLDDLRVTKLSAPDIDVISAITANDVKRPGYCLCIEPGYVGNPAGATANGLQVGDPCQNIYARAFSSNLYRQFEQNSASQRATGATGGGLQGNGTNSYYIPTYGARTIFSAAPWSMIIRLKPERNTGVNWVWFKLTPTAGMRWVNAVLQWYESATAQVLSATWATDYLNTAVNITLRMDGASSYVQFDEGSQIPLSLVPAGFHIDYIMHYSSAMLGVFYGIVAYDGADNATWNTLARSHLSALGS